MSLYSRYLLTAAFAVSTTAAFAGPTYNVKVAHDIVGQTSTATIAGGGNPLYIPPLPQYSGAVAIRMDYADGAFVCSGSLINNNHVLTAAHCISDGTQNRPLTTTVYFYEGADDPSLYGVGPGVVPIQVEKYFVRNGYSGEVVDQNDMAILRLASDAPVFAPRYELSDLSDLTSIEHIIAGYGVRSDTGGSIGSNLGVGRLRYAGNRFDFRFGDDDFEGYFNGAFGPQGIDHVWLSDFDDGTAFRDGGCNLPVFEAPFAPAIFAKPVFTTDKYCNLGIGAFEGIGGGGDSGSGYFVDGKLAAVHSFALWYRDDESRNRFGQFKGAVPIYHQRQFILQTVPTPSTILVGLLGLGLLGAVQRKRRAA